MLILKFMGDLPISGVGKQQSVERSDFEILLLFYLEIEMVFQIINHSMVSFEFLCSVV